MIAEQLIGYMSTAPNQDQTLTRRETEVLNWMAKGKPNKEIAQRLHISVQTVQSHVKRIYRKLGAHNKIEAINKANLLMRD